MACAVVWAQATAQINGTVQDQTGAVLAGVEIIAAQTDTGISRSVITDETGSFALPNLATGLYRLEAGLPPTRKSWLKSTAARRRLSPIDMLDRLVSFSPCAPKQLEA